MKFNTQIDEQWKFDIMTARDVPNYESKTWCDYMWRWGCLITSSANIIQFFIKKEFTPKDLNEVMQIIKGYNYLQDNFCKESEASNIHWPTFQKYIENDFEIRTFLKVCEYENKSNKKYIARVKHYKTKKGHYINIIDKYGDIFWCFDVETGLIESYQSNEITFIHEFTYKGEVK